MYICNWHLSDHRNAPGGVTVDLGGDLDKCMAGGVGLGPSAGERASPAVAMVCLITLMLTATRIKKHKADRKSVV